MRSIPETTWSWLRLPSTGITNLPCETTLTVERKFYVFWRIKVSFWIFNYSCNSTNYRIVVRCLIVNFAYRNGLLCRGLIINSFRIFLIQPVLTLHGLDAEKPRFWMRCKAVMIVDKVQCFFRSEIHFSYRFIRFTIIILVFISFSFFF